MDVCTVFAEHLLPPVSKHIAMTIISNSCINRHGKEYLLDELIFSVSVSFLS